MTEPRPVSPSLDWSQVWSGVAARLADHWAAGLGHILTEDTLRMATILELVGRGVDPQRLTAEVISAPLGGGKIDLALDGAAGTVVELKYPRDSRTGYSPDTMTWGELIRDFLRVALVPAQDRWVTQVLNQRLEGYVQRAADRHGLTWPRATADVLTLGSSALTVLPKTTRTAIGETAWVLPITAQCVSVRPITSLLTLYAYNIADPTTDTGKTSSGDHESELPSG